MTTDLPMRQIYNFGSYYDAPSNATYTLVQASYSDALKAGYWAGLLSEEDRQAINTSIYGGIAVVKGTATYKDGVLQWPAGSEVSHPLFTTVHDQFVTLLQAVAKQSGTSFTPVPPIAGAAMDWATDPFGGGVNFWNVGADIPTVYGQILNPIPMTGQSPTNPTGVNGLFVVGEGYSLMQGWVEGALWTVEDAMAKAYANWSVPSWLSPAPVPPCGADPVYLFVAQNPTRYLYSTNRNGAPGPDWTYMGAAFSALPASAPEAVQINRYSAGDPQRYSYGPGAGQGWTEDGVAFFAPDGQTPGAVPVYQYHTVLWTSGPWNLFYSLDPDAAPAPDWTRDGSFFSAFPP